MSSIIKLLRRIGGVKATPTAGEEGQLAVWKAGKTPTDAASLYFHDGNQWVELLDTSRNPRVIDANDTVAGLRITQRGSGEALRVEDEANPDATPFVIDNAGNVGIGMTPEAKLDVAGTARFHTSAYIRTKIGSHSLYLREVGGVNRIDSYDDSLTGTYTDTPLEMNAKAFTLRTGPLSTQRIDIDTNGNLLKGTLTNFTTPYGAAEVSILAASAGVVIKHVGATGGGAPTAMVFLNGAGTPSGYISVSATTVAFTSLSDYRLKENVTPLSDATSRVKALRPVRFNFKVDPDNMIDGFLAHEVQAIVPEAVAGEKDNVTADGQIIPQGLDAGKLIPILTAALQDALKRIEALEARP